MYKINNLIDRLVKKFKRFVKKADINSAMNFKSDLFLTQMLLTLLPTGIQHALHRPHLRFSPCTLVKICGHGRRYQLP